MDNKTVTTQFVLITHEPKPTVTNTGNNTYAYIAVCMYVCMYA